MKNPYIPIILTDVINAVASVRAVKPHGAATPDYIAAYTRMRYIINYGTPVCHSWNARFGRFLQRYACELGIREVKPKQPYRAADGGRTSCSVWTNLT